MQIPATYNGRQHQFYQPGYSLPAGIANNAFSQNRKPIREDLLVTPLQIGSLDDLQVGSHIAFQDFDGEEWMECKGLRESLLILQYSVPIYVFDNHNHAFYGWAEALDAGWCKKGAVLVHMDAHYDDTDAPHSDVDLDDLEKVFLYTNEVLQIATFVKPALQLGLFSEVINYVESPEFELLQDVSNREVVLNLDLDVFCDEMSHVSYQQKIAVLNHYLPQTTLITMSTSPFFIPQEKAIAMAKRVVNDLFD